MFKGRKLLIATKHHKEKVMAPVLENAIGVTCVPALNFDTDVFGNFTGEIARTNSPLVTARNKCLEAMRLNGCDMAVSSEGSFGPHPTLHFVPCDEELIFFTDTKNKLEIVARELSTETNFNKEEVKTEEELKNFAENAKFPSHGLILRTSENDFTGQVKGIHDPDQLLQIGLSLISKNGSVFAETDMRALHNPTRMKVIELATFKLVNAIKSVCPNCNTPGFSVTEVIPGLPCQQCGLQTRSTLSYRYTCKKCSHQREDKFPGNKKFENPMYCDYCNP